MKVTEVPEQIFVVPDIVIGSVNDMLCVDPQAISSPSHLKDFDRVSNEVDSELPQFTLGELRGVLNERNKLKIKLYEMEEELERLAPSSERCDSRLQTFCGLQSPISLLYMI